MSKYTELDAAIVHAIENHATTFSGLLRACNPHIEVIDSRGRAHTDERRLDARLQALRKAGEYNELPTRVYDALIAGWNEVQPAPAAAITPEALAQIIRKVDGSHNLGAAALADAIFAALPELQAASAACVPSIEAAQEMGAKGGPVVEAERLTFEAWMRGHCWALCATWNGKAYVSDIEQAGGFCAHASNTRRLWAAWRDRAALGATAQQAVRDDMNPGGTVTSDELPGMWERADMIGGKTDAADQQVVTQPAAQPQAEQQGAGDARTQFELWVRSYHEHPEQASSRLSWENGCYDDESIQDRFVGFCAALAARQPVDGYAQAMRDAWAEVYNNEPHVLATLGWLERRAARYAGRSMGQEPVAYVPVHPSIGPLWGDTYPAGSSGDGRPARYERRPLYTAPPVRAVDLGPGIEAAAKLIQKMADDYAEQFGHDDMGGLSFGSGRHADVKSDHHNFMLELVDKLRAMIDGKAVRHG